MPMSCYCVLQYPLLGLQAANGRQVSYLTSPEVLLFCNVLCQVVKQARGTCQDGHMFTWSNGRSCQLEVQLLRSSGTCSVYKSGWHQLICCLATAQQATHIAKMIVSCQAASAQVKVHVTPLSIHQYQKMAKEVVLIIKTHSSKKSGLCLFILYLELILHSESQLLLILDPVFGNCIDTVDAQL